MINLICKILIFGLFCTGSLTAGVFNSDQLGCRFVVPEGWQVDESYPDQLIITDNTGRRATITVKRYILEADRMIGTDEELVEAIIWLYGEIGIENASRDNISFTHDGTRATFETDWLSRESSGQPFYRKSLHGTLARLIDGRQVLYLIISECPEDFSAGLSPIFRRQVASFQITERLFDKLYPKQNLGTFLLVLLILLLTVFFFARNRRIQNSKHPLGRDSSSFWRCSSCGRVNHLDNYYCGRCGAKKVSVAASRRP